MMDIILATVIGFGAASVLFVWIAAGRKSAREGSGLEVQVHGSIDDLKAVGELVVFKIVTKEIVTAADHWLGDIGKKYFAWLISTKKMAMIFEFDIDFRYDLRSPEFKIEQEGEADYRLHMPSCTYQTHFRDISFYDEQDSKLLPWLVPDLLNRALGPGFDEADKNRLKDEAKLQARKMAEELVQKLRGEVQGSARQTVEALAKGFGARRVIVDFGQGRLTQGPADASPPPGGAEAPAAVASEATS